MIFSILLYGTVALAVLFLALSLLTFSEGALVGLSLCALPASLVCLAWSDHASDIGTIKAQHLLIEVYEQRVNDLSDRLGGFSYQDAALANMDTPVASAVASLSEAESQLASARALKAKAEISIEKRRYGPMSHVIGFVGDYK